MAASRSGGDVPSMSSDRRPFEYRMSKKVAELTQVIHILFVHNHEKEVRLTALVDAYEHEIELVIADAKSRIKALEDKLKDVRAWAARTDGCVEQRLADCEREWTTKMQELETRLRKDNETLRSELERSRQEVEQLHAELATESADSARQLADRGRELDRFRQRLAELEKSSKEREGKEALKRVTLETELADTRRQLASVDGARESLVVRCRRLEDELLNANRQQHLSIAGDVKQRQQADVGSVDDIKNMQLELVELRQEIRRLRNELGNREVNFNRIFTAHQPVHVAAHTSRRPHAASRAISGGAAVGVGRSARSPRDGGENDLMTGGDSSDRPTPESSAAESARDLFDTGDSRLRMSAEPGCDVTVNPVRISSEPSTSLPSAACVAPSADCRLPSLHGLNRRYPHQTQLRQQQQRHHHPVQLPKPIPIYAKAR